MTAVGPIPSHSLRTLFPGGLSEQIQENLLLDAVLRLAQGLDDCDSRSPADERVSVCMEADEGTKMSITVQKTIPAGRMRQFHQMVDRWLEEGPIRLATNATLTAMDNAGIPKAEQAAIIEDRDIIMKHNMRLGVISEVFAPAIEKAVNSSRSGSEAKNEIARLIVTAIGIRQDDDSELVTFNFSTQSEADAFDELI